MMISLRPGMEKDRDEVIKQLIDIQYTRNEMDFHRGTFRVRGDVLEIFPANSTDRAVRVEFSEMRSSVSQISMCLPERLKVWKPCSDFPCISLRCASGADPSCSRCHFGRDEAAGGIL